jgi:flagellar motor switch protein FliG
LSALGETDPDSLSVLEKELADWVARRSSGRARRCDPMAAILAAADGQVRDGILSNLRTHNQGLAGQITQMFPEHLRTPSAPTVATKVHPVATVTQSSKLENQLSKERPMPRPAAPVAQQAAAIRFDFEDLVELSSTELEAVLREVDANVLVLALTGSSEELVDRIAEQMPRRSAKEFRRQLRRHGPTRLSDVATAQRAVASVAARRMGARRLSGVASR